MSWAIDSADGLQLTCGLSEGEARTLAQEAANRLGAMIWLYQEGDLSPALEVRPAPGAIPLARVIKLPKRAPSEWPAVVKAGDPRGEPK